ncbi:MAG TPA: fibronectin type III domain-containing protein, partial [Chloroflexota bacterium]|nr:fibronectin type III domain-containing protein [Chloroflexota bacterium]
MIRSTVRRVTHAYSPASADAPGDGRAGRRSADRWRCWRGTIGLFLLTALAALFSLNTASGAAEAAAPTTAAIVGEIERITLNDPNDVWSGGTIVVGGQNVIVPRNLLADFPANRLTLQQTFAQAPAACVALGESGLAKADRCNTSRTGAIATIAANRTAGGNTIAGDVFFQKGIDSVAGTVTFIDHTDGYFRLNGNPNDPTTGIMVRLNDPISRHTVQQGLGCAASAPNCSPDPRFTLDPDNYTNVFSSGYPYCLPSTVARRFADVLDLNGNGNRTELLTAQSAANGAGDLLCPTANRNLANLADDSRRLAPLQLGDAITVEGNFETINGVRFLSAHSSVVQGALATKDLPDQPDYMFFDEMFIDAPGFQNQRVRTLFIGFTTLPSDVLIWSTHHDPATNQLHELPLATTRGCDNAGGPSTCSNQGVVAGAGSNIFRIRHDVDFLTGATAKLNPCAHLRADPRFAATNPCPQGGTQAEQFAVLSPIPHEVQARTGHKVADLERAGGPILVTLDVNGQEAKNGQYLFPMGIGLGGIDIPNGFEIDLNIVNMPFFFSGMPWNLDRRLSPGGCVGPCEATPQPLDPFPFEGGDPRTQANLPTGPYNDPTFTASRLTSVRDRVLSFIDGTRGTFGGDRTVLAWPPADPPARPILPVPPLIPADTTPPSPPTRVAAFAVSTSQIVVTWGGATDNVGVVGYRLFRDGGVAPIATITDETSFLDSGLAAGTTHRYTVVALDAANNASAPSAAASATTTGAPAPDRTPPVLTLPANITATATGPTGAVVTYTATANDAVSGPVTPTCTPASGS